MMPLNDDELKEAHYYGRICRPAQLLDPCLGGMGGGKGGFKREEGKAQHEDFV